MATASPYKAPAAAVADQAEEYQEVRLFAVSGRIGRVRYIAYSIGVYFVLMLVGGILGALLGAVGSALFAVLSVGALALGIMLTIQRAHDFNTTGWLSILVLVPLVNFIFWFIPGTDGENDYGPKTPPNSVLVVLALIVPFLIIPILAAISIPAYNDYVKRAQERQLQQK
jgi:uncharacterized membrane protein YhaH (DUF805 family)